MLSLSKHDSAPGLTIMLRQAQHDRVLIIKMTTKFLYNFVRKHNISKTLFIVYFTTSLAILYFILFTIFGQKGLIKYFNFKEEIAGRENVKQELLNKVETKKNMVQGMNLESIDIDLLDEQARKVLGYAGKNEVVIYQDKKEVENGKK